MCGFLFISMLCFCMLGPLYFIDEVCRSMNFPVCTALTPAASSEFEDAGSLLAGIYV